MDRPKIRARKSSSKGRGTVKKPVAQCLPHEILRMIFKFLTIHDLSTASIVCRSWLKAARDEIQARGPVCIKWHKSEEELPGNIDSIHMYILVSELDIKPKVGIFWGAIDPLDCPSQALPDDCYTLTIMGTGGALFEDDDPTEKKRSVSYTHPSRIQAFLDYHGFFAFLPQTVRVEVEPFFMLSHDWAADSIQAYYDSIEQTLNRRTQENNADRCVLLFTAEMDDPHIQTLVDLLMKGCNSANKFCLWGGNVQEMMIHSPKHCKAKSPCGGYPVYAAIVITGAVQCWSMVMADTHDTVEKIEKKLIEFRNKVHLNRRSMGFMFTSNNSLVRANKERKRKGTIFKKLFPGVPLLDCYGKMMAGNNTVEDNSNDKDTSGYNSGSTAFMIIRYN